MKVTTTAAIAALALSCSVSAIPTLQNRNGDPPQYNPQKPAEPWWLDWLKSGAGKGLEDHYGGDKGQATQKVDNSSGYGDVPQKPVDTPAGYSELKQRNLNDDPKPVVVYDFEDEDEYVTETELPSTIFTTQSTTVYSCPESVTNCALGQKTVVVLTTVEPLTTTIKYPISSTEVILSNVAEPTPPSMTESTQGENEPTTTDTEVAQYSYASYLLQDPPCEILCNLPDISEDDESDPRLDALSAMPEDFVLNLWEWCKCKDKVPKDIVPLTSASSTKAPACTDTPTSTDAPACIEVPTCTEVPYKTASLKIVTIHGTRTHYVTVNGPPVTDTICVATTICPAKHEASATSAAYFSGAPFPIYGSGSSPSGTGLPSFPSGGPSPPVPSGSAVPYAVPSGSGGFPYAFPSGSGGFPYAFLSGSGAVSFPSGSGAAPFSSGSGAAPFPVPTVNGSVFPTFGLSPSGVAPSGFATVTAAPFVTGSTGSNVLVTLTVQATPITKYTTNCGSSGSSSAQTLCPVKSKTSAVSDTLVIATTICQANRIPSAVSQAMAQASASGLAGYSPVRISGYDEDLWSKHEDDWRSDTLVIPGGIIEEGHHKVFDYEKEEHSNAEQYNEEGRIGEHRSGGTHEYSHEHKDGFKDVYESSVTPSSKPTPCSQNAATKCPVTY